VIYSIIVGPGLTPGFILLMTDNFILSEATNAID